MSVLQEHHTGLCFIILAVYCVLTGSTKSTFCGEKYGNNCKIRRTSGRSEISHTLMKSAHLDTTDIVAYAGLATAVVAMIIHVGVIVFFHSSFNAPVENVTIPGNLLPCGY